MDRIKIDSIRNEIERRRSLLIKLSYDKASMVAPVERQRIQSILERQESPSRPEDIPTLVRQFCASAFSYAPLRRYLSSLIDNIPMRDTIHVSLSKAFGNEGFLSDSTWEPDALHDLAFRIQRIENYDLANKQFKPRIISVLLTGTQVLSDELKNGMESLYHKIECANKPSAMWDMAKDFSRPINNVGVILICDFFKEI